jgi:RimK family alpha-L-glutamate ligase
MSNILILVGGGVKHIKSFVSAGDKLGVNVDCVSFAKLEYTTGGGKLEVLVEGKDIADYDVVYLRLVGKRYEDAALVVHYCRQNNIRLVDRTYEMDGIIRVPLAKSLETKLLIEAGLPVPKTYFGRMNMIARKAPELFGFPFVIKGTTGKQGHAVWLPRTREELDVLVKEFTPKEKKGKARYLAQEFIKSSQRNRVFIIGEYAIAAITRPTRWRKRFIKKVEGEFPEGKKEMLRNIPKEDVKIAVDAASALGVEIGGADILTDDKTGKKYILEVNSAPRWEALAKDTGINIEEEIVKYLSKLEKRGENTP